MFWEKFITLCNANETSPSAVCAALGLSNSAAVRWKKGSVPQDRTINLIASYFNVSASCFYDKEPSAQIENAFDVQSVRMVPVYESVSAGFGTLARNEVVTRVPCAFKSDSDAADTLGIKVHGDSMYPKIEDGDIVIVHKQDSIDSGTLGVVIIDGDEGYVKRVEYGEDWIFLHSINPMYPVMKFKGEDVLRVQVVGRVTKIIKDV